MYAFHHIRMVLNEANIVICCGDQAKMWHADPQSAIYITNYEAAGQELLRLEMVDLASFFWST